MVKEIIHIEIAYAGESHQVIIPLTVGVRTTVLQAIEQSDILLAFPNLKIVAGKVGIFGRIVALETILKEGDRVEIYRDLRRDPKEARRDRAKHRHKSR